MENTVNHQNQLATQLSQELYTRSSLSVSPAWLASFLSTVRQPPPPLPALVSTANFRLLNTDFTKSLSHNQAQSTTRQPLLLPISINDVNTKHAQLQSDVPVQVLDILDVGSSKYAQIEAIERVERGEEIRGREVIRNVPVMNEDDGAGAAAGVNGAGLSKKSAGPHRLMLQDAAGTKMWAFELTTISKICITSTAEGGGLHIGSKMLLKKGLAIRRGLVMLEPEYVNLMGGKIEEWDRNWRAGRKQRLMVDLKKEDEQQRQGD